LRDGARASGSSFFPRQAVGSGHWAECEGHLDSTHRLQSADCQLRSAGVGRVTRVLLAYRRRRRLKSRFSTLEEANLVIHPSIRKAATRVGCPHVLISLSISQQLESAGDELSLLLLRIDSFFSFASCRIRISPFPLLLITLLLLPRPPHPRLLLPLPLLLCLLPLTLILLTLLVRLIRLTRCFILLRLLFLIRLLLLIRLPPLRVHRNCVMFLHRLNRHLVHEL